MVHIPRSSIQLKEEKNRFKVVIIFQQTYPFHFISSDSGMNEWIFKTRETQSGTNKLNWRMAMREGNVGWKLGKRANMKCDKSKQTNKSSKSGSKTVVYFSFISCFSTAIKCSKWEMHRKLKVFNAFVRILIVISHN